MTDLEMTKLCAKAAGETVERVDGDGRVWSRNDPLLKWSVYDPLHDDEQAMALLKKFGMRVDYDKAALNDRPQWYAQTFDYERNKWNTPAEADELNRAIVECAAASCR